MRILVTGAAGFIGFTLARRLLEAGHRVVGVDNLSPYYDVRLKQARLEQLEQRPGFSFHRLDIAERASRCIALFDGQVNYDGPADQETMHKLLP